MIMRVHVGMVLIAAILLSMSGFQQSQAQDTGSCMAFVEQALTSVGNACDVLDRNSVCYGFNRIDAAFFHAAPDTVFALPSDRVGLVEVQSLHTAPLDNAVPEWGVAVMSVQADIPGTLPGQSVK